MPLQHSQTVHMESRDGIDILRVDNSSAIARISCFGGQVLSYTPKADGRERLWLSDKAVLDGSKAIRGGIPICWPWFGAHEKPQYPAHGYVRTQNWQLLDITETADQTHLTLAPSTTLGDGFGGEANLELHVNVGTTLNVSLVTTNIGDTPFSFGAALHTYLAVNDIHTARINGIEGQYQDKLAQGRLRYTPDAYTITAETDRIHLCQTNEVEVVTDTFTTRLNQTGHDSIVVWNPWITKTAQMNDMPDDGYLSMLCIEAAVTAGHFVRPAQSHQLTQTVY